MTRPGDGRGAARLAGLVVAGALLPAGLAVAQPPAAAASPAPALSAPRDYVESFCLPLAGGYVADTEIPLFLREWKAKPGSSAEAGAKRPVDVATPGQPVVFAAADAPSAFLESRRGVCSLVWKSPALPAAALRALSEGRPPVGSKSAPTAWARIAPAYGGRPPPPKYLLRIGGSDDRGVCAERFEDLRLRDGSPASMLQLSPCRLAANEHLEGG